MRNNRHIYDRLMRRANNDYRNRNDRNSYPDVMQDIKNSYFPYSNPNVPQDDNYIRDFYQDRFDYRMSNGNGTNEQFGDYHFKIVNQYNKDLKEGIERLRMFDRFKGNKDEILKIAKQMGIEFREYTEEEFMFMLYYIMSEFPKISNDIHQYVEMAKSSLENKFIEPSQKVAIILEEIVLDN